MKMKFIFLLLVQFVFAISFSQYIGVRARYTDTRMVPNPPYPDSRENRLILSFFEVSSSGNYTPVSLSDYDVWIYKTGFQYGSFVGGVLDSSGNNYPGYAFTAPQVVSYYNSYQSHWIDCDPNLSSHYLLNGYELDCGFVKVSYWETDNNTGLENELFVAPNVCLPYYIWPNPLAMFPGNVNFTWPVPPTAPYNWYSYVCGGTQQVIIRGVLPNDTSIISLPVRFANEKLSINDNCIVKLNWANLTESDINYYSIERSVNGSPFQQAGIVFPSSNNNNQADYEFPDDARNIPGILLYRIKAIENNGQHFYSSTLKVKGCRQKSILTLYPNPARNAQFTFKVTDLPSGQYDVLLVNDLGQVAKIKELNHPGGPVSQLINNYHIPSGTYFFILRSGENSLSQKLIITN